eukprot:763652-Hanusia_phi.AAC.3
MPQETKSIRCSGSLNQTCSIGKEEQRFPARMTKTIRRGSGLIALLAWACQTVALPVDNGSKQLRAAKVPSPPQEKLSNVTFVLPRTADCEDVKNVVLVGSWSSWRRKYKMEKNGNGEFTRTLLLPNGKHEFKIFKDGVQHQATKETIRVSSSPTLFTDVKRMFLVYLECARTSLSNIADSIEQHKKIILIFCVSLSLIAIIAQYQRHITYDDANLVHSSAHKSVCSSLAVQLFSSLASATHSMSSSHQRKEPKQIVTKDAKTARRDYTGLVEELMKEVVEKNPLTEVFTTATEAS